MLKDKYFKVQDFSKNIIYGVCLGERRKTLPRDESNDHLSSLHGSIDCTWPSILSTEAKSNKDSG